MLVNVGLDAVLMLHFLIMGMKIFGVCSVFGIGILIPVSASVSVENATYIERISITVIPEGSNRLIAYLVFTYLVTFVTFFFLTQSYYNYIRLHAAYLINLKKNMVSRSIIVSGIPRKERSDEALADYYRRLNIGPVESSYVVRTVPKLHSLIKKRASALMKLEEAYATYWGNPCQIPGYDPDLIMDDMKMYKRVLDLAEKNSEGSDNEGTQTKKTWKRAVNTTFFKGLVEPLEHKKVSRRPMVRTGFLGLWGPKVDAIEHYTELFGRLDKQVSDLRNEDQYGNKPEVEMTNVGFVTFKTMNSAVIASQIAIRPEPFVCRTVMAYEPRDVLWSTVSIRGRERLLREIIVWSITLVLVVFWFVPVLVLSSLMSINTIAYIVPSLADKIEENAAISNFMTTFVPTVILNIVTSVLPLIFDLLGYYQGLRSRSAIAESTFSKYFFFLIFLTLIVFTLAGTSIQTIALSFANDPSSIPKRLASTFPSDAHESPLVRLINRPRAPWSFNYGTSYPVPLLIFVVVLEYSCISPLILLFGTLYFSFTYFVYKYQLLYVYFRPYEAAGRLWIMTVPRVIFGLLLFQLTMIGLFAIKSYYKLSIVCLPLTVLTLIFKFSLDRAFLQNARNLPLQMLCDDNEKLPVSQIDTDDDDSEEDENTTPTIGQTSSLDMSASTATPMDKRKQFVSGKWKSAAFSALQLKKGAVDPTQIASESALRLTLPHHKKVVLDEDDYEAKPDRLTDYRQPPMQLTPGLLDCGLKKFGNPLLVGVLPQLWLPVKEPNQATKEGKTIPKRHKLTRRHSEGGGGRIAQNLAHMLRKMETKPKGMPEPEKDPKKDPKENNWNSLLDGGHIKSLNTDALKGTHSNVLDSENTSADIKTKEQIVPVDNNTSSRPDIPSRSSSSPTVSPTDEETPENVLRSRLSSAPLINKK
ncbi:hypothetical protein G6F56_005028 [Rhizopus delemar]|nr:hypothetical protein G6F56_005028 [Rhizopus delemar]